ncbi:hypothetical protein AB0M50_54920, partial [Nonomuraea fuscirosea]|uniref:hypothetical protein n=1 Tax=Nonomuraea fuscirosea TaxID=1291556 RepID=UPI0034143EA6
MERASYRRNRGGSASVVLAMPDDQPPLAATERAATAGEHAPVVVFLHGVGCARDQFAAQLAGLDRRLLLLSLDLALAELAGALAGEPAAEALPADHAQLL